MNPQGAERRTEERYLTFAPLLYFDTFLEGEDVIPYRGEGRTYDISGTGLCFRTNRPIAHMMPIRVTCPDLWEGARDGTVRWCAQIGDKGYRVGVTFEEAVELPAALVDPFSEAARSTR